MHIVRVLLDGGVSGQFLYGIEKDVVVVDPYE